MTRMIADTPQQDNNRLSSAAKRRQKAPRLCDSGPKGNDVKDFVVDLASDPRTLVDKARTRDTSFATYSKPHCFYHPFVLVLVLSIAVLILDSIIRDSFAESVESRSASSRS